MAKLFGKSPKKQVPEIVGQITGRYAELKAQGTTRLDNYKKWTMWFKGDHDTMWDGTQKDYIPDIVANIIESNVRTIASVLTDSKPRIYVVGREETAGGDLALNLNVGVGFLWHHNYMNTKMQKIVLDGLIKGTLSARTYWNESEYNGLGEIRTEPVDPAHCFCDENVTIIDVTMGECDIFIYAMPQPLGWFRTVYPEEAKDITSDDNVSINDEKGEPIIKRAMYYEAYMVDKSVFREEKDGVQNTKSKYPKGRMVVIGGDVVLRDEPAKYFPFSIEPIATDPISIWGASDVERLIPIQRDFNSKLSQISQNIALSANRQFALNGNAGISKEELIEHSGEPGFVFDLTSTTDDLDKYYKAIDTPTFNPELFQYIYFLPQLAEQISGVTKPLQGVPAKRERETAQEVTQLMESATIRIRDRARHIEAFLTKIAWQWVHLMKENYREPRHLFYVDPTTQITEQTEGNGLEYPRDENGEPMDFEFDVVIQPDSTIPVDMSTRANQAIQLAQMQMLDPPGVLEALHFPNAKKIGDRMSAAAQTQQGGTQ